MAALPEAEALALRRMLAPCEAAALLRRGPCEKPCRWLSRAVEAPLSRRRLFSSTLLLAALAALAALVLGVPLLGGLVLLA